MVEGKAMVIGANTKAVLTLKSYHDVGRVLSASLGSKKSGHSSDQSHDHNLETVPWYSD